MRVQDGDGDNRYALFPIFKAQVEMRNFTDTFVHTFG
jgi:hypothetical protein